MYIGFKALAQGDSHKEKNLPCQDAVECKVFNAGGIAIVADGHGSEKHFRSDRGSKIAVQVAFDAIVDFLKLLVKENKHEEKRWRGDASRGEEQLQQLEAYIISHWRQEVLADFTKYPLTETEGLICAENNIDAESENDRVRMYGTTLIAAMTQKAFWIALQIGDGKCVILDPEGTPRFPVPEDENLGGGKTTSLCDTNALENFRHSFGLETIKGVTVASDGVTDSFIPEKYLDLHRRIYSDFCDNEKTANEGIQKSLPVWSSKGSRDDVSMAGVFFKAKQNFIPWLRKNTPVKKQED
jgi:serine/threonine protein phosphatase PrpC